MKSIGKFFKNLLILLIILTMLFFIGTFIAVYVGTSRYPIKQTDVIEKHARTYGVEPNLIAAIVKTESDFVPDAQSAVGARGLMQLMPDTAKWAAEQLKLDYSPDKLDDPDYNIKLGTFYISYLIQRYQNKDLAIAAYNTGFSNVDKWLKEGTISWERESLKAIPFSETRDYVIKVNRAKRIYDVFYAEGDLPKQGEGTFSTALDNYVDVLRWTAAFLK